MSQAAVLALQIRETGSLWHFGTESKECTAQRGVQGPTGDRSGRKQDHEDCHGGDTECQQGRALLKLCVAPSWSWE